MTQKPRPGPTTSPEINRGYTAFAPDRDPDKVDPSVQKQIASAISGGFSWPWLFKGQAGSGKTYTACLILDNSYGFVYVTEQQMVEEVLAVRDDTQSGRRWLWWDGWRDTGIAVIDEVGVRGEVTDWRYECVKKAIDLRIGKPLIVISNNTISELASKFDDRVASRLAGGTVIDFGAKDRRIT